MIAVTLAACAAALHPLAGDDVYAVSARMPTNGDAELHVEVIDGWHLNREYPSAFEDASGSVSDLVLAEGDARGSVAVPPTASGTLHIGFCDAEKCRIEHVVVALPVR